VGKSPRGKMNDMLDGRIHRAKEQLTAALVR